MRDVIEFADIDKNKLKSLVDYNKEQQKILIEQAIKDNLLFYIIYASGRPLALDSGDVARIKSEDPIKVNLNFQNNIDLILIDGYDLNEKYGWQSIWIEEQAANLILSLPNLQGYRTKLLDAQNKAIEKFWLNHDPQSPPIADDIKAWLIAEFKIAVRMAESIDAIIRPDEHKPGGYKKRKKTKGDAH